MARSTPLRLTAPQTAKLYNWLEEHKTFLQGLTVPNIAKMAKEKLGFPITDSSVYNLAKDLNFEFSKGTKTNTQTQDIVKIKLFLIELTESLCGEEHELTERIKQL